MNQPSGPQIVPASQLNANAPALMATPDTFAFIRSTLGLDPEQLGRSVIYQVQSALIVPGNSGAPATLKFTADTVALGFMGSVGNGADADFATASVRIQFGTTEDFITNGQGGATSIPMQALFGRGAYRPGFMFPRPRFARANEIWTFTSTISATGPTTPTATNLAVICIELARNLPR